MRGTLEKASNIMVDLPSENKKADSKRARGRQADRETQYDGICI